jgi:hypothetical protein
MLVVINSSKKLHRAKVRGIIGRYCWRLARDVWIWPKASIPYDLEKEIEESRASYTVIFIWRDNSSLTGLGVRILGASNRYTEENLFRVITKSLR